jgi:hypothetical protein
MHTVSHYFIGNDNRAYRSEISLFRYTRETADDCWMVEAQADATMLYEIIGPRDKVSLTVDLGEARDLFLSLGAQEIHGIPVVD